MTWQRGTVKFVKLEWNECFSFVRLGSETSLNPTDRRIWLQSMNSGNLTDTFRRMRVKNLQVNCIHCVGCYCTPFPGSTFVHLANTFFMFQRVT